MVVCEWLYVAYVGYCIVSYESCYLNHVFTGFSYYEFESHYHSM